MPSPLALAGQAAPPLQLFGGARSFPALGRAQFGDLSRGDGGGIGIPEMAAEGHAACRPCDTRAALDLRGDRLGRAGESRSGQHQGRARYAKAGPGTQDGKKPVGHGCPRRVFFCLWHGDLTCFAVPLEAVFLHGSGWFSPTLQPINATSPDCVPPKTLSPRLAPPRSKMRRAGTKPPVVGRPGSAGPAEACFSCDWPRAGSVLGRSHPSTTPFAATGGGTVCAPYLATGTALGAYGTGGSTSGRILRRRADPFQVRNDAIDTNLLLSMRFARAWRYCARIAAAFRTCAKRTDWVTVGVHVFR